MAASYTKVRPLPAELRDRLEKLLLVLGSASEGERASAIGMINRLLASHGLDWHDVVGAISNGEGAQKSGGFAPPPPQPQRPSGLHTMTDIELRKMVDAITHRIVLNENSRQFLVGMRSRADHYSTIAFSAKQWAWMQDLARKAGIV